MPRYDYKCDSCNTQTEYTHPMSETLELHTCEACEIGLLHRVFTPAATHFKGQGWGKTYRVHKPKDIK